MGPGATVGVLGTGIPRLACLRPVAWLNRWPSTSHLHQPTLKTLARGQASWGGRRKASSGAASPGRLARRRRDQGRSTSRGAHDASHDDRGRQAGASPRIILPSSLVQRGQAQPRSTEASGKGCHFSATRPRPWTARRRSPWSPEQRHHQNFVQAKTTFVRIACTSCAPSN